MERRQTSDPQTPSPREEDRRSSISSSACAAGGWQRRLRAKAKRALAGSQSVVESRCAEYDGCVCQ